MSIETTIDITREEAKRRIIAKLAENISRVELMDDTELEDLLYSLTRDSNRFENYQIR
jgi:hypothetical protein